MYAACYNFYLHVHFSPLLILVFIERTNGGYTVYIYLIRLGFDTQNYCNYIWEDGKAYDIGTANMILFTVILGIKPIDKTNNQTTRG